jgi:hypothetical protein
MYTHRIIAFVLFTSLFFTASCIFAGATWYIFSLRSHYISQPSDDLHAAASTAPEVKREEIRHHSTSQDDSLRARTPAGTGPSLVNIPSSATYAELAGRETVAPHERPERHKPQISIASSSSGRSREDSSFLHAQIKTDEETPHSEEADDGF